MQKTQTAALTLISKRHSCRSFAPKKVPSDLMTQIGDFFGTSPSAGGLRALHWNVVSREAGKKALAKAAFNQSWIAGAPYVFIFSADKRNNIDKYKSRAELYAIQDATIACAFAMIAAEAVGLSSCWIGAFSEEAVKEALGMDERLKPVALLPIGYRKVK